MDEKIATQHNFGEPPPYEPNADLPASRNQPESPPTYVFGAAVNMSYVKSVRGKFKTIHKAVAIKIVTVC